MSKYHRRRGPIFETQTIKSLLLLWNVQLVLSQF